jgi:hypothetical protein
MDDLPPPPPPLPPPLPASLPPSVPPPPSMDELASMALPPPPPKPRSVLPRKDYSALLERARADIGTAHPLLAPIAGSTLESLEKERAATAPFTSVSTAAGSVFRLRSEYEQVLGRLTCSRYSSLVPTRHPPLDSQNQTTRESNGSNSNNISNSLAPSTYTSSSLAGSNSGTVLGSGTSGTVLGSVTDDSVVRMVRRASMCSQMKRQSPNRKQSRRTSGAYRRQSFKENGPSTRQTNTVGRRR